MTFDRERDTEKEWSNPRYKRSKLYRMWNIHVYIKKMGCGMLEDVGMGIRDKGW